ncbi:MAG: hypothetical protein KatS3mg059_0706 [Thermomicrobiales bacterium]|nr:MAG: hypothetical protein KatS3mg059_0706 [Thermomicrobiales bacterium]
MHVHVVHVSTGQGLALIAEARARGIDVSCETCPHYLIFTEDDLERLGAIAKCAPPLRSAADQEALWQGVAGGAVSIIASDHSPAPPELKSRASFFDVWGGISGCQSLLPALLTAGYHQRGVPLERIAALTAAGVARRFRLASKGQIAVGFDADLALVRLDAQTLLRQDDLLYRHRHSPYIGLTFTGQVVQTIRRGVTVARDGQIIVAGGGRLVRPAPAA